MTAAPSDPAIAPTSATALAEPAGLDERIDRVARALEARNIEVVVVDIAADAREAVLARVPEGSEVHWGKSKTLDDLGISTALMESTAHDAIRPRYLKMDRTTQRREIRKLISAPDVMLGSVSAVTEDGAIVAASATGSQLGPYVSGAGRLILVIGSQKIVPTLEDALHRIEQVVYPFEDAQVVERLGVHTRLEKVVILYGEWQAGRTTLVISREPIGV